ncbi:unnamed protein product [Sphacelaria rigidula]
MQAMDPRHVSLCAVMIRSDGFNYYRCDRSLSLGLPITNMSEILEYVGNEDTVTLKAEDSADTLTIMKEDHERISGFKLKAINIDNEQLGIPKTEYNCTIQMPSAEFARIVKDLAVMGKTCTIKCDKDGVTFSVSRSLGVGSIMVQNNSSVDREEEKVTVTMEEPVTLRVTLSYLTLFTKATPLGPTVTISMTPDNPIVMEYPIGTFGYIRYYLAPAIDGTEE